MNSLYIPAYANMQIGHMENGQPVYDIETREARDAQGNMMFSQGIFMIISRNDIIGSPYEFDRNNIKTKSFSLFSRKSQATDDSIMTIAIAKALMTSNLDDEEEITTVRTGGFGSTNK